jgi:CRISPR-associated protein (Cas_Cas02710)
MTDLPSDAPLQIDRLVLTVGHSPLPVVMAVRALKPKSIVLIHSPQTRSVADRIKKALGPAQHVEPFVKVEAKKPADLVAEFLKINGLDNSDICTTSGTKAMSVALDIAHNGAGRSWHVLDELRVVVCSDPTAPRVSIPPLGFSVYEFAALHGCKVEVQPLTSAEVGSPQRRKKVEGRAGIATQALFADEVEGHLNRKCALGKVTLHRIKRIWPSNSSRFYRYDKPHQAAWAVVGNRGVTVVGVADADNVSSNFWRLLTLADSLGGEHGRVAVVKYFGNEKILADEVADDIAISSHRRIAPINGKVPTGALIVPPLNVGDPDDFADRGRLDQILQRELS